MMTLNRVVITGLGALTPLGNNVSDFWDGLRNGVSGANEITRFDTTKFKTHIACELKNFEATDYMDKKDARKNDPFIIYAIVSVEEAIKDSKLLVDRLNRERCGVVWASGIGGVDTLYSEISDYNTGDGTPRFSPFLATKMIVDMAAGQLAIKYGFKGANYATVSACASSANAIIDAYYQILLGNADVMIAGGSESPITPVSIGGFNAMHALSTRNDDCKTASRPYDKDRDGFVIGEGAGALILESLPHALKRKAKIYAEISGVGLSCDAFHITAPDPNGYGAALSMKNAISNAKIRPTNINYINTHGTSTSLGDVSEINAIKSVFGNKSKVVVSSTKSMTGHLLGAAGAIEAIASILSIKNGYIPPTINHFTDDPDIDPCINILFNKAKKRSVNYVMSNAFGFGGHNTSIIFKKFNSSETY